MYQKAIDRDCELRLAEATAIWSSSQDLDATIGAATVLAGVEPTSACYPKVKSLFLKIENRAKELTDRPWEYQLKVLDAEVEIAKGSQQLLMEYAKNQPSTVMYNIRGWY